jgi:hypothetical protein
LCDFGSHPKAPLKVSESAESKGNREEEEEEEEEEANRVPFSLKAFFHPSTLLCVLPKTFFLLPSFLK